MKKITIPRIKNNKIKGLALTCAIAAQFSAPHVFAVDDGAVTDYGVTLNYSQSSWPTDHHGPRNDDFSQFVVPTKTKIAWENIQRDGFIPGASTVFAGTVGTKGDIYITSGRGRGFSNMHGFNDKTGETVFQSPVWLGDRPEDGLDQGAIAGTPTHDVDGNMFVPDQDQFWSFDENGELRWVVDMPSLGIESQRIFLNPVITNGEGYVGGVTLDGLMAFFDREDGSLTTPLGVISEDGTEYLADGLPGGKGPSCPPVAQAIWLGGEVGVEAKNLVFCVFFGYDVEIANTAAIAPRTGRMFIGGIGRSPEVGSMYGLDLVSATDYPGIVPAGYDHAWKIAWEVNEPIGANIGASATISPDGQKVYVTDGSSTLHAFDADDGSVLFSNFGGDSAASPSIDMNGDLFASAGATLVSLDGVTGEQRFNENYDFIADQFLDPKIPVPFLVPNGNPVARIASVINLSPGKVTVPLSLGYEFAGLESILGRAIPLPHANAIISVDPETGLMLEGSLTEVPDGVEGALTPTATGRIGVDQAAIFSSLNFYLIQFSLPLEYWQPLSKVPSAGYIGLMPESFREFALEQVDAVLGYGNTALNGLPNVDIQSAFDELRRGRLQLKATLKTINEARDAEEINEKKAKKAKENIRLAQAAMDQATNLLHQAAPSIAEQNAARQLAEDAVSALTAARGRLN